MPLIETHDLWKTYVMGDQEIHAVSGIDIEIKRGEYVAIMGPSGSGKSTLMNLIGCLDTPTQADTINGNPGECNMTDDELARIRNKRSASSSRRSTCCRARPAAQRRTAVDLCRCPAEERMRGGPTARRCHGRSGKAHGPQAKQLSADNGSVWRLRGR